MNIHTHTFVIVQLLSCVRLFATPRTAARQGSLSFTIYQSWLKLISIESVMLSNYIILCCPLLLPSIFPSIRVFSNESALRIRWPKVLELQFQVSPSNEYSGLISFRIDWLDFLAVQRTLKGLLHHLISKASELQFSAVFMVQLSHPYLTTRKTIALVYKNSLSFMLGRYDFLRVCCPSTQSLNEWMEKCNRKSNCVPSFYATHPPNSGSKWRPCLLEKTEAVYSELYMAATITCTWLRHGQGGEWGSITKKSGRA